MEGESLMGKLVFRAIPLLLLILTATAALADKLPGGVWWKDQAIARRLQLSPQEAQQLDRLYADSRRRMIGLKNDVEREQRAYQRLMEGKNLDEAAVNRQVQQLEKARSQLAKERSYFMLEVRKILGHQRFQELKAIYQKSR
jgi:Spy/CpxP family protein refolding chaperone